MTKRWLPIILLTASSFCSNGQTTPVHHSEASSSDRRETGVVLGLNYSQYLFGEVGYFRSYVYEMEGFEMHSTNLAYGGEFSYIDRLVVAPKVQARVQLFFLQASLAPILYTDFKQMSLKIRPEIGLGLYNGSLSYGYNAGIVNNHFQGTSKYVFSVRYFLTRQRKSLQAYDQKGKTMR